MSPQSERRVAAPCVPFLGRSTGPAGLLGSEGAPSTLTNIAPPRVSGDSEAALRGREQACLRSRPGWVQAALRLDPWRRRCQWEAPCGLWAVPGLRSEAVCLWMILTCRETLPDSRARGAAGPRSSAPGTPGSGGGWALCGLAGSLHPHPVLRGGPSAPAVLAALFANPGGRDSISHWTASHFLPDPARTRLTAPAARRPRLHRKQAQGHR